jgi:hypothetical protein
MQQTASMATRMAPAKCMHVRPIDASDERAASKGSPVHGCWRGRFHRHRLPGDVVQKPRDFLMSARWMSFLQTVVDPLALPAMKKSSLVTKRRPDKVNVYHAIGLIATSLGLTP